MSRILIILLGLIALAILAFFCINKHSPVIEDDLVSKTQLALDGDNKGFATAGIDGRELVLTGIAPDEAARERAGEIARGTHGVRTVDNQLTLAQAVPAVPVTEPVAMEEPVSRPEPEPIPYFEVKEPQPLDTPAATLFPVAASPYRTDIVYEGGKVVLTGLVADESSRLWLVSKAKEQFGSNNIDDQMTVAYGAPQGWHTTAGAALANLGSLDQGKASLVDNGLTVTGYASSIRMADQVETQVAGMISSAYKGTYDIKADEPPDVPAYEVKGPQPLDGPPAMRMPDPGVPCQQKFNELLANRSILFDTNLAIIKSESNTLLDQLVSIAKGCPNSSVEIGGHTDDRGSNAYNQKLSESRANAVVDYLKQHGVTSNRLHGVGYGELQPIADNATQKGMAKNRRIEFKVGEK